MFSLEGCILFGWLVVKRHRGTHRLSTPPPPPSFIFLRVLDMARTSVICGTPEVVRQLTEQLKACPDVAKIGRMKNGFGSTAVGRGGYRDIKVNLMPAKVEHYVEVQVMISSLRLGMYAYVETGTRCC